MEPSTIALLIRLFLLWIALLSCWFCGFFVAKNHYTPKD